MLNKRKSSILLAAILFLGSALTITSCSESKKEEKTDTMMSVDSAALRAEGNRLTDSLNADTSQVLETRPVKTP